MGSGGAVNEKNLDATRTTRGRAQQPVKIYLQPGSSPSSSPVGTACSGIIWELASGSQAGWLTDWLAGNTSSAFDQLFGASILTADRRARMDFVPK